MPDDPGRPDAAAPAWSDHVGRFLAYLAEEERSQLTRDNYGSELGAFAAWHRSRRGGEDPDLGTLTKRDLLDWKDHIQAHGRQDRQGQFREAAPATVNRKLSAMRSFIRWAQEEGMAHRLDAPKPRKVQGRHKPKALEPEERKALVRAVESKHDTRDILLIRCGLEAGLRVAELAALTWSDVKITERKGKLTVRHGKGNKHREIDLTRSLRVAFLEHGYERNRGKDRPVFQGKRGALSVRGIQDIIERYARSARVGKRVGIECTAHTLRHTCADWLLNEQGMTVPEVAEILGHSDLKITMIYLTPHKGRLSDRMSEIEG